MFALWQRHGELFVRMEGAEVSARQDVFDVAGLNDQSSRYYGMRAALDAYRYEVLREAAEAIRNRQFVEHYGDGTFGEGSDSAADLIDPEVTS